MNVNEFLWDDVEEKVSTKNQVVVEEQERGTKWLTMGYIGCLLNSLVLLHTTWRVYLGKPMHHMFWMASVVISITAAVCWIAYSVINQLIPILIYAVLSTFCLGAMMYLATRRRSKPVGTMV